MGLGDLGQGRVRILEATVEPAGEPRAQRPRPAGPGPKRPAGEDTIGDDYRFDGLWEDLPRHEMRAGVDMLVAHFGVDDAKRFIDTLTRARMKQLAFNGTDSALRAAQELAPQLATAARQVGDWAKTNPVVLGGVLGSVASAALSYMSHKRRVEGSSG